MRVFNRKSDEVTNLIEHLGLKSSETSNRTLDFKDLMRYRINKILLVSSIYDYYTLVEDGQLAEAIFNEFFELNLHYAPHLSRVNSGEAALKLLHSESFDIVITMQRLGDMELVPFCNAVREHDPDMPVVLLSSQSRELQILIENEDISVFDYTFIWTGDRRLFLAIIKIFEDIHNTKSDSLVYGVRTIILVEDSPSFYSSYLPLIYTEMIKQVQMLIEEGKNFSDKLLRQRARPKILHARTYEEAEEYFKLYGETLLGIITDMKFEHEGKEQEFAGLRFIREVRKIDPEIPILLQTSHERGAELAEQENVRYIDKSSRMLFQEVSAFIQEYFGFGDFVFRMPDGTEVNRARTLRDLNEKLKYVPDESVEYHASRDHFSNWLMARTRFALSQKLKPVKINQFDTIDELRRYLRDAITRHLIQDQQGIIADFSRTEYNSEARFMRIGEGSLGGKARGLAFIDSLLEKYLEPNYFPDVRIAIPGTISLGTDVFTQFMEINNLLPLAVSNVPDEHIVRAFIHADLPPTILGDLRAVLQKAKFPLAVRSSSLLEDTLYQPFAGIYATVMLPNSSPDFSVRFHNLTQAIKFVYASTYFRTAKNYIEATGNRIEEEHMGVIIQEMVGTRHGKFFYPHFSGVARSYNYYPFSKAKPRDGVVNLALGLGKTIVDGDISLEFSPAYPTIFPQFGSTRDLFKNSQIKFYALDLQSDIIRKVPTEDQNLQHLHIQDAEQHGTLDNIASTWSAENDSLYEGVFRDGPRVLNFAPILKSGVMPLIQILKLLVGMCETAMNCPVEIEFAVTLGEKRPLPAEFSLLQVRPMVKQEGNARIDPQLIEKEDIFFQSDQALGNGLVLLKDIIFVKSESFDVLKTRLMGKELSAINAQLVHEHRPYLLIGPGRWGSSDPSLGIPVSFGDISGARAIVETTLPKMIADPSQGSHFFQNLTSFRIFYFTLRHYDAKHAIDWDWLQKQEVETEKEFIRHVSLQEPIEIIAEGKTGHGIVLKRRIPELHGMKRTVEEPEIEAEA